MHAAQDERHHAEATDGYAGDPIHPQHGVVVDAVPQPIDDADQNNPPQHRPAENSQYQQQRQYKEFIGTLSASLMHNLRRSAEHRHD